MLLLWSFYCLHLSHTCISMVNNKCKYGIILSQMGYIFIDGIVVFILGYAMPLCYPEDKLDKVWSLNPPLLSWIDILYFRCFIIIQSPCDWEGADLQGLPKNCHINPHSISLWNKLHANGFVFMVVSAIKHLVIILIILHKVDSFLLLSFLEG